MSHDKQVALVCIVDPQTSKTFYVNTTSGDCYSELPQNATVVPKDETRDEWWELMDKRRNLPYFYNTRTRETVWVPPTDGLIITLIAIQNINTTPPSNSPEQSRMIRESVQQKNIETLPSKMSHHSLQEKEELNNGKTISSATSLEEIPNIVRPQYQSMPTSASLPVRNHPVSLKDISNPIANPEAQASMNPFNLSNKSRTQAMSLPVLNRQLPPDLKNDITQFQISGFAQKYFATHRKGIFRRKVPVQKMLVYQKDALGSPLLTLAQPLHKDATRCFKLLLKILTAKGELINSINEIQQLLEKGIRTGSLRDEIFVQSIKQLTQNPYPDQIFRGWQMMSVLTSTFPPSTNLEHYLKNFIEQNFGMDGEQSKLDIIIRYSYNILCKTCKTGPRGRTMSKAELEHCLQAPFKNSVFGDTLERIMERQAKDTDQDLPVVLTFLVDNIVKLEGHRSEGIFRVPGDAEGVSDLRCRIEKNDYNFDHITDPNIPSSLLKLWLRELEEPLIPAEYYSACITVGQMLDDKEKAEGAYKAAWDIVENLPDINAGVCKYMIGFLKMVGKPENQPVTKMSPANIAMVFAPNFLRCPSDNPVVIFENTKFEQAFLKTLIS
ncbi:Rho GTPase activation protein [Globomyces pollinis-pini]|nr:Rho GTPase activation protein [Globomyces pollinis-pini]